MGPMGREVGEDGMTQAGKDRIRWGQSVIYTYTIVYKCDYTIVCYVYLAEECVRLCVPCCRCNNW